MPKPRKTLSISPARSASPTRVRDHDWLDTAIGVMRNTHAIVARLRPRAEPAAAIVPALRVSVTDAAANVASTARSIDLDRIANHLMAVRDSVNISSEGSPPRPWKDVCNDTSTSVALLLYEAARLYATCESVQGSLLGPSPVGDDVEDEDDETFVDEAGDEDDGNDDGWDTGEPESEDERIERQRSRRQEAFAAEKKERNRRILAEHDADLRAGHPLKTVYLRLKVKHGIGERQLRRIFNA